MNTPLVKRLERWVEIAQGTFEKENWNECSLLHSFGDQLADDLKEAIECLNKIEDIYELTKTGHGIGVYTKLRKLLGR